MLPPESPGGHPGPDRAPHSCILPAQTGTSWSDSPENSPGEQRWFFCFKSHKSCPRASPSQVMLCTLLRALVHVPAPKSSAGPLTQTQPRNGARGCQPRVKSSPWRILGGPGSHHRSQDFLHKFPFRDRKYVTGLRGENALSSA